MTEEVPVTVNIPALNGVDDDALRVTIEAQIQGAVREMLLQYGEAQARLQEEAHARLQVEHAASAARKAEAHGHAASGCGGCELRPARGHRQ